MRILNSALGAELAAIAAYQVGAESGLLQKPVLDLAMTFQGHHKEIYARCLACHALAYDRTGPRHCGLFSRRAGSVKDFAYSDAMKRSKIVWDERTLDRFLANPLTAVPGTAMGYAGVVDGKERANLIAYLKQADLSPE